MAAPMRQAQWAAGPRKSGTYAAYLKWYAKSRKGSNTPSADNPWFLAPRTRKEFLKDVERETIRRYKPQREQIEREATYRNKTIADSSAAASALLASHAGITQGAYSQATADLAGIGAGYTGQMQARVDAAQKAAADFGQLQGTPAEQPTVDTAALHDTAYMGGVDIPGSSLAEQGANWTAMQNAQAAIPEFQAQQDIRQTQQESAQALLELAQKRPELRSQVMQELWKQELDRLQAGIQKQAQTTIANQFGETVRHHVATEDAATRRNDISYQRMLNTHQEAINRAAASGIKPNASLSKAYGYIVDGNGKPILDKNGRKIPVAKNTSTAAQKQKANKQYEKAAGEAVTLYQNAQSGTDPKTGGHIPAKHAWRFSSAVTYLMNKYGISRSRARQAAIDAGFKPPGRGPGGTGPR